MANVTLTDVRKTYAGGFEAIKGISLDVGDGQFCVLVGPSGCGKSTLLRMIAGLETTTSGKIDIGGRIVNEIEPAERDIAMVFQNYALYPHMSVYNNMAYGLRNRRMPEAEIDTRVNEAAKILELGALLATKAAATLRRPAPARRDGPRHRAAAQGVSVRRAAVQPRRQAAHRHARRNPQIAAPAEDHVDLRHPRPARGDDAGRYPGGDEWRPGRAARQSARCLPEARNDLRRLLHRRAADEPDAAARCRAAFRPRAATAFSVSGRKIWPYRAMRRQAVLRSTSPWRRSSASAPKPTSMASVRLQGDAPTVSAKPGELPPGEVIVRVPGTSAPAIGQRIRATAPREKLHLFSADGRSRIEL